MKILELAEKNVKERAELEEINNPIFFELLKKFCEIYNISRFEIDRGFSEKKGDCVLYYDSFEKKIYEISSNYFDEYDFDTRRNKYLKPSMYKSIIDSLAVFNKRFENRTDEYGKIIRTLFEQK